MSKTIVYIRVSTSKQETENQKFEIAKFCDKKNIIVDEWVIEVMSGTKDAKDRMIWPAIKSLVAGDTLIVTEMSRIGRNMYHIMEVLKFCLDTGINIFTVKEGYELKDDIQSKVMAFAFGIAADIERSMISQRTKEALSRKKHEGVILGRREGCTTATDKMKLFDKSDRIIQLLRENKNYSQIGKEIGAHRATVRTFVERNNLKEHAANAA